MTALRALLLTTAGLVFVASAARPVHAEKKKDGAPERSTYIMDSPETGSAYIFDRRGRKVGPEARDKKDEAEEKKEKKLRSKWSKKPRKWRPGASKKRKQAAPAAKKEEPREKETEEPEKRIYDERGSSSGDGVRVQSGSSTGRPKVMGGAPPGGAGMPAGSGKPIGP